MKSYTVNSLFAPGVPISENTSWHPIFPAFFASMYSLYTFSTTFRSFPAGFSGASGYNNLASVPRSLASCVIFKKLSSDESTPPLRIASALWTNSAMISFWQLSGSDSTMIGFPVFNSGTSRSRRSEVQTSATSRNVVISSGRLTNLLNLLLKRKPLPSTVSSNAVVTSPNVDAHASK